MSHTFTSLVLSEGEEEDDADHNTKDFAAAADADDNDNKDNASTSMPPRVKPVAAAATKTAKKMPKNADEITHLPAPKLPKIWTFSIEIEAEDPLTISYYATSKHDYAGVVICVSGTMECGEYKVGVTKDGRSILFVPAIHARPFDKIILKKIMKDNYQEGSACVLIAWDNTVQEMEAEKVHPKNGLYWGMPQVA